MSRFKPVDKKKLRPVRYNLKYAKQTESTSWRTGKTTAERGYGSRWRRLRAIFLRKHPLCVFCQQENKVVKADVVDHIIPHRGDQKLFWNEDNWQPLCFTHHNEKTKTEDS